ncbi:hypothetical protein U1Q18_034906 [Sarracenia purpurea var. burkii]
MARLGLIPMEARRLELDFLNLQRHWKSAPERAEQQGADGGTALVAATDGLHDIRPSLLIPQIVWPAATAGWWTRAAATSNATITNFAYASMWSQLS